MKLETTQVTVRERGQVEHEKGDRSRIKKDKNGDWGYCSQEEFLDLDLTLRHLFLGEN